jgi:hypothetical protein
MYAVSLCGGICGVRVTCQVPQGLTDGTKLTVEELITLNGFCSNGPYHYLFVIIKVNFSKQSDPIRSSFTYLELQNIRIHS